MSIKSFVSGTVPLLPRDTAPSEHEHDEMSVPTADHYRPDADAAVEDTVTREARSTDAAKLTFPVQMVIGALVMTCTILGGVYGMVNGIRDSQMKTESDLRDLRTRFEMQSQVDIARNEARTAELKSSTEAISDLRRLTQMLQLQFQELSKGKR